jgi:hypothetical protein
VDGLTLSLGVLAAITIGIAARLRPHWWLVPIPLALMLTSSTTLDRTQDWYERVPEDVQFALYFSLLLATLTTLTGVLAAWYERRRTTHR